MEEKKRIAGKIIKYVEERLNQPEELSLDQIAVYAGYSKFHLNRLFSQVTGSTLHQYIREQRLKEAARKLAEGEDPIAEIAWEAAYQSQQAFTLAFKQVYGVTPLAYRKAVRIKAQRGRLSCTLGIRRWAA